MTNLQDLRDRIAALPEPYQSAARINYRNAWYDISLWPESCVKTLASLEESVEAHEAAVAAEAKAEALAEEEEEDYTMLLSEEGDAFPTRYWHVEGAPYPHYLENDVQGQMQLADSELANIPMIKRMLDALEGIVSGWFPCGVGAWNDEVAAAKESLREWGREA